MRIRILAGVLALLLAIVAALAVHVDEPDVTLTGQRLVPRLEREFRLGDSPARQPLFSPDGKLLALANARGDIHVLRTADWSLARRIRHPRGATTVAFSPDGATLFSGGYDGIVRRWNLQRGRFAGQAGSTGGTIWSLDLSPDGTRLAVAGEDRVIHLWDAGRAPPRRISGHTSNIWQARFSPAGDRIASGSFDYSGRIWNVATGQQERLLEGHTQAVVGLDYRPNGAILATSGDDNSIRLWRTADGALLRTVATGNHTYSLAFSPDGRWLVSGGRGRSAVGTMIYGATGLGRPATPIHVWRVADGAMVAALPDETDVFQVAFAPDGKGFVTANDNGVVRLWKVAP